MMKRLVCITCGFIIMANPVSADGWLDLFADDTHSSWCLYVPAMTEYLPIDVYFFARSPSDGFRGIKCKVVLPDPAMSIVNVTYHPNKRIDQGEWATGIMIDFDQCMTDIWVLVATINILVFPPGLQPGCQLIDLAPYNQYYDNPNFTSCAPLPFDIAPEHDVDVYVNCDPCPGIIAIKGTSWGAIKSLYVE